MLGLGLHTAKSGILSKSYSPASDMVFWYNEESISLFPLFSYPEVITDMSGNGYDLEQPDSAKRPQVYPIYKSLTGLFFTNDSLFKSYHSVLKGNSDFTIIYAGANFQNYHTAIYVGDDDVPDNTSSFRLGRGTTTPAKLRAVVGDDAGGGYETDLYLRFNGFKDIAYAYKNGTDSSDIYVGLDNGDVVAERQFNISGLDLSFGDGIGIGTNNPDNPALAGTGSGWYIYEILVYDRSLTAEELEETRLYLRKKWNV
jgi:hypothetical protein